MGIEYFEFMDTFYCEVEDEIGKVVKQRGENLWIYEKQLGGKFYDQRALIILNKLYSIIPLYYQLSGYNFLTSHTQFFNSPRRRIFSTIHRPTFLLLTSPATTILHYDSTENYTPTAPLPASSPLYAFSPQITP